MKEQERNNQVALSLYQADVRTCQPIICSGEQIQAGFPSTIHGSFTETIDLNKELVPRPATTFYARVHGDSMKGRGIDDGDLLVIDKSLEPQDGDIVVAFIDGEFTLKTVRFDVKNQCIWLVPANEKYSPIRISEENNFLIWGVLTYNIKRQFRKR